MVDVSTLGGVKTHNLSGCTGVVDVTAHAGVHILSLRNTNVVDVSALGNVFSLNLAGCQRVKYVSALGHVHTLIITNCPRISDVRALARVHTLRPTRSRLGAAARARRCATPGIVRAARAAHLLRVARDAAVRAKRG